MNPGGPPSLQHPRSRRWAPAGRALVVLGLIGCTALPASAQARASTCFGTTANGRIEDAVKLPTSGANFTSYSQVANLLGRTHVHSAVNGIVIDAYERLARSHPDKVFVYAETGWPSGGRFRPHKTHQNGLSVDFMVPVVDPDGESVPLPTRPWNKWGYSLEFDAHGRLGELKLDFEALGAHLVALHQAARDAGFGLWRVIFDPELQPALLATRHGGFIRTHISLSKKRSWVRHDEHYHVDFAVPCDPL